MVTVLVFLSTASVGCGERSNASAPASWRTTPPLPVETPGLSTRAIVLSGHATVVLGNVGGDRIVATSLNSDGKGWTTLPRAPLSARDGFAAVATPDRIVIWGGTGQRGDVADGAAFLPTTGWMALSSAPLEPRYGHSAVFTGKEVIVWGGRSSAQGLLNDGATYDPARNTWAGMAESPLSPRADHLSIWTGTEMIIWGGIRGTDEKPVFLADGAAYDPRRDSWRRIAKSPLRPGAGSVAFWTGKQMITWDGHQLVAYDPKTNYWSKLAKSPLSSREGFASAIQGERMFVWGGTKLACGDCFLSDGAVYDVKRDRWDMLPAAPLGERDRAVGVAFDQGVLFLGGCCRGDRPFLDGAVFSGLNS